MTSAAPSRNWVGLVACPVCGQPLEDAGSVARCPAGHVFDFASKGHLNLLVGRGSRRLGDSGEMARARAEFLAAGHLDRVIEAVAEAASGVAAGITGDHSRPVLAEIGSGTGEYLARAVAAAGGVGIGVDLSKQAAGLAARSHPGLGFVVADAEERIPLGDGAADAVISAFAPRPAAEIERVLSPGGRLVACFANPGHLAELREDLGLISVEPRKLEALRERLSPGLRPASAREIEYELELGPPDVVRLVAMGPSARHAETRVMGARPVTATVSVTVATFLRA